MFAWLFFYNRQVWRLRASLFEPKLKFFFLNSLYFVYQIFIFCVVLLFLYLSETYGRDPLGNSGSANFLIIKMLVLFFFNSLFYFCYCWCINLDREIKLETQSWNVQLCSSTIYLHMRWCICLNWKIYTTSKYYKLMFIFDAQFQSLHDHKTKNFQNISTFIIQRLSDVVSCCELQFNGSTRKKKKLR